MPCSCTDPVLDDDHVWSALLMFPAWRVQVWWTIEKVLVPWFITPVLAVESLPPEYVQG